MRHAARSDAGDDGVRELVDEHLLESLLVLFGPGDRNPDPAVVLSARPHRCVGDIAKLPLGVEHRNNRVGRILAELAADAKERGAQRSAGGGGQRLVGASFEHDPEALVAAIGERAVRGGVAPPEVQLPGQRRVARRICERLLVGSNRQLRVTFVVGDPAEQNGRRRQRRPELDRALETRHGLRLLSLRMRDRSGAEQNHGIVGREVERVPETRGRAIHIPGAKRSPPRLVQLRHGRLRTHTDPAQHRQTRRDHCPPLRHDRCGWQAAYLSSERAAAQDRQLTMTDLRGLIRVSSGCETRA